MGKKGRPQKNEHHIDKGWRGSNSEFSDFFYVSTTFKAACLCFVSYYKSNNAVILSVSYIQITQQLF